MRTRQDILLDQVKADAVLMWVIKTENAVKQVRRQAELLSEKLAGELRRIGEGEYQRMREAVKPEMPEMHPWEYQ